MSGWHRLITVGLVLLGALAIAQDNLQQPDGTIIGTKMFGDRCNATWECGFNGSICVGGHCQCTEDMPVTNHLNKCGKEAKVNESCSFNEQCEEVTPQTECRDGVCVCMFEMQAILQQDGTYICQAIKNVVTPVRYVDPTMIGILVAMFLMFITICVVLRLFSRARWQENRTIFNTPNPRLMNVSLLRESKLERRGSKSSARGPSRQPSMVSVRAVSPNSQGSRRGSRGSSNVSVGSLRSINKNGPPNSSMPLPTSASQTLESVIVEKRSEEI
ncbi:uncharacterized protein [Onthophagus taurus]|uniref:uncharacterized protein isoform X2 n=1 Tax=Onthophagus taurus TaxID=166361 RepID=UPI000C2045B7|nr:uncharacterized protein LOC111416042 isoform X2 [Onthophagus taurus]